MPSYVFHTRDADGLVTDEVGIELDGPAPARDIAVRSLADMAQESLNGNSAGWAMAISVLDGGGRVLFRFSLTFEVHDE